MCHSLRVSSLIFYGNYTLRQERRRAMAPFMAGVPHPLLRPHLQDHPHGPH
ncbi:hypothetical protein MBAV_002809 [Candidatus Magnetobacterium bavaricum]|uniref:Uncharacterized protein n=1 Tax=Candidatus Magnetobacterium bavaricum TaxID=29290 RepID=A0A0F3GT31_9BACT|nr:hypothetical protein MBAV_002809 [Candidatus Magnetobacterium bavaricum]